MLACSPKRITDISPMEKILTLATRLVTRLRHLPYEERMQRLGRHSLQWSRVRLDPIFVFKIFSGVLGVRPKRAPSKVNTIFRGEDQPFWVWVMKHWNKLPAWIAMPPPPSQVVFSRLNQVWTEIFPHLSVWPLLIKHSCPQFPSPSLHLPTAHWHSMLA